MTRVSPDLLLSIGALTGLFVALPQAGTQTPGPPQPPALSAALNRMDHGPFVSWTIGTNPVVEKGIAIKVGPGGSGMMTFDTDLLRVAAAWTGGLTWYAQRDGLALWPTPGGPIHFGAAKGPGWTAGTTFADPRPLGLGPLPRSWGHYRGLHVHGNDVVLSYRVGATDVLERPGLATVGTHPVFLRTFKISGSADTLSLRVLEVSDGAVLESHGSWVQVRRFGLAEDRLVGFRGLPADASWHISNQHLVLQLPSRKTPLRFDVAIGPVLTGRGSALPAFGAALNTHLQSTAGVDDLETRRQPGPARWPALETQSIIGTSTGPFAVDTFTLPETHPFNSYIRPSGLDFLSDGRAVVSSVSGDVWLVSGISAQPGTLQWKRFATGLSQPLGVRVVDNRIYVTGRDQITRLHDLNGDNEADFYENFNNEVMAANNFHEFAMNLETDSRGNFYFTKGTAWPAIVDGVAVPHTPHNGVLFRLPPDGSRLEVIATGLRYPNGLAVGPGDLMAYADNQGNWVPTSVVHMLRPGGFYGFVPAAPSAEPPADFERPIVWTPHLVDNSPGSPLWIPENAWGPLGGRMLLTSYGKAMLSVVLTETVDGQVQGGFYPLPLTFEAGIMRGRFRPDGHLYVAGLTNWQSAGTKVGSLQRVRYTGGPLHLPTGLHVRTDGVELQFGSELDPATAVDPANYRVEQWNYRWIERYGSGLYRVSNPNRDGRDTVVVESVRLSADRRSVLLAISDLRPVMQMEINVKLKAVDGRDLTQTIYSTIHKVPGGN